MKIGSSNTVTNIARTAPRRAATRIGAVEATKARTVGDVTAIMGIPESEALGPARLELDAEGAGPETVNIVGSGRVFLSAGQVPDVPEVEKADAFLNAPLAGTRYDAAMIEFTIANDRIVIAPFQLITEALHVDSEGDLGIAGDLALRAQVSLPADDLNLGDWQGDFSEGVVEALTNEQGWVSVPLVIDGTIEEPRVRADSEVLMAALQQSAGRSLGNWLRGVIKRND